MKTLPILLLVDDDPEIRDQMKWALASDYELLEASDRPSALVYVRQAMVQIVLLDLGLPPDTDGASEGLAVLSETIQINPMAKVIVVTGNSDRSKAIAAIESGGYDFIEKPVQLDVLKIVFQRANYLSNLEQENWRCSNRAVRTNLKAWSVTVPNARSGSHGTPGWSIRCSGADHWRERHWKGVGRSSDPRPKRSK